MICHHCAINADQGYSEHPHCRGGTWCDCQHSEIIEIPTIELVSDESRTEEGRGDLRSQD